MNVVVTGGAGFVGSHLVDALVRRGDDVVVVDACLPPVHEGGRPTWLNLGARYLLADPRAAEADVLAEADGADAIVHLAARTGTGESLYEATGYTDVNAGLSAWLAQGLVTRTLRPGRVVYASTRAVYGDGVGECPRCGRVPLAPRRAAWLRAGRWEPPCARCEAEARPLPLREDDPVAPGTPYALSKLYGEQVLLSLGEAAGVPVTALRFFNLFGPRQSPANPYVGVVAAFAQAALTGSALTLYEDGLIVRDFCAVDDAVDAVIDALDAPDPVHRAVNVGSGVGTSLWELAAATARAVGRDPEIGCTGWARFGDPRSVVADVALAARLLGWAPRVSLDAGLAATVAWLRDGATTPAGAAAALRRAEDELARHGLLMGQVPA